MYEIDRGGVQKSFSWTDKSVFGSNAIQKLAVLITNMRIRLKNI